jgi:hypothetical protein
MGIQNGILVIIHRNEHTEVDPLEEVAMSQNQSEAQESEIQEPEQAQQSPVVEESPKDSQEEAPDGTKKRVRKKAPKLTEADVQPPKPSIWPLALALAIAITMAGSVYNALFLGIGGALVLACVVGWAMERRR